jgi:hypothetical protein
MSNNWYIFEEYSYEMRDAELNRMMKDLSHLAYHLHKWQEGDIKEEQYRETVQRFKSKYFENGRIENLKQIITEETEKLKNELLKMLRAGMEIIAVSENDEKENLI